ncbi:MAG TPA: adenylate/guanylate cyclase domain-containing protein [Bryobacteraceae bacterium]|nr:adenylate/guanylate cyclase domain-containing protein [Bryobacteraceae bacterium]
MADPSSAPFLKFEEGDGREIPLISGNVWKIGRGEQNAIVLIHDMVSRNHAMIQQLEDGEFYLIDMDSRNGSFLNGQRLTAPVALRDGDRLSFGKSRLCFRNPARATVGLSPDTPPHVQNAELFKQATVSVLVVDIRGSAVLAQQLDPEVLNRLLNTWSAEADRIMRHHGSTAEKHIGDAVVTFWTHGAKGQEQIEILRILRAVEEIARITAMLDQSFILAEPLRIGAGVYTGLAAVASNTGGRSAYDFTTLGDSVNAALSLESVAKELETDLVLGVSTMDYVRTWPAALRHFRTSERKLQGCDAPVKIWSTSFTELGQFLAEHREGLVKATTGRTYPADKRSPLFPSS